jgi:hypothetical protein
MVTLRENCPVTSGTVIVETLAHRQVWEPSMLRHRRLGPPRFWLRLHPVASQKMIARR